MSKPEIKEHGIISGIKELRRDSVGKQKELGNQCLRSSAELEELRAFPSQAIAGDHRFHLFTERRYQFGIFFVSFALFITSGQFLHPVTSREDKWAIY